MKIIYLFFILFLFSCDSYEKKENEVIKLLQEFSNKEFRLRRFDQDRFLSQDTSGSLNGSFFLMGGEINGSLTSNTNLNNIITFSYEYEKDTYVTYSLPFKKCHIKLTKVDFPVVQIYPKNDYDVFSRMCPSKNNIFSSRLDQALNAEKVLISNRLPENSIDYIVISLNDKYYQEYIGNIK